MAGLCRQRCNGVGEVWGGAFDCYQYIDELPAGQYTLSVDAFYRCADNDYAKANMAGNADLNTCFIYAGDATKTVKALFDGRETAPNGMGEAATAFANGEYTNELTFNHPGGTLRIGIKTPAATTTNGLASTTSNSLVPTTSTTPKRSSTTTSRMALKSTTTALSTPAASGNLPKTNAPTCRKTAQQAATGVSAVAHPTCTVRK